MAVSPDGFRTLYFQGHPEYDANSLLKEYKRDLELYLRGERATQPPLPEHYLSADASEIVQHYTDLALSAVSANQSLPDFPEAQLKPHLDNTWGDTAKAIFNNWLGLIYQLTNLDRKKQYMDGVDPADPLGLSRSDPG